MKLLYFLFWIADTVKLILGKWLPLGSVMQSLKSKEKQEDSQPKCTEKREGMSLDIIPAYIFQFPDFIKAKSLQEYAHNLWPVKSIERFLRKCYEKAQNTFKGISFYIHEFVRLITECLQLLKSKGIFVCICDSVRWTVKRLVGIIYFSLFPDLKSENDELKREIEQLKAEIEFADVHRYRANVVLDPKTAHPRLNVSDGKCFWDTGNISKVPNCEERFDSHTFVLAKECFSKGRHYWEVEVGEKRKWDLGVASEFAHRKGEITLSPQNGYWVIGLEGRKNYWARTEQWTYLKVSGKPTKIGIFLNMPAGSLCFYDVHNNRKLYTFSICCSGKLYPFFSTGSVAAELDSQPLKISPWLEEDDIVEEDGKKANISEMAQD
ncbi:butyrophilin subfamily 3 member A1-like [Podarcis lilfordi]|nr:butyrophilin subfamily 3 member A1-like [Podarcis lilfordi]